MKPIKIVVSPEELQILARAMANYMSTFNFPGGDPYGAKVAHLQDDLQLVGRKAGVTLAEYVPTVVKYKENPTAKDELEKQIHALRRKAMQLDDDIDAKKINNITNEIAVLKEKLSKSEGNFLRTHRANDRGV